MILVVPQGFLQCNSAGLQKDFTYLNTHLIELFGYITTRIQIINIIEPTWYYKELILS